MPEGTTVRKVTVNHEGRQYTAEVEVAWYNRLATHIDPPEHGHEISRVRSLELDGNKIDPGNLPDKAYSLMADAVASIPSSDEQ